MNETVKIKDIVKSGNWIQISDGMKVYEKIVNLLKSGKRVELSFEGRDFVITAFLNAAIGKLYDGSLSQEEIDRLKYIETDEPDREKIDRVVRNAKIYYENKNNSRRDEIYRTEVER